MLLNIFWLRDNQVCGCAIDHFLRIREKIVRKCVRSMVQHDGNGNCWHLSLSNPIASVRPQSDNGIHSPCQYQRRRKHPQRAGATRRGGRDTLGRVSNNPLSLISRRRVEHPRNFVRFRNAVTRAKFPHERYADLSHVKSPNHARRNVISEFALWIVRVCNL